MSVLFAICLGFYFNLLFSLKAQMEAEKVESSKKLAQLQAQVDTLQKGKFEM